MIYAQEGHPATASLEGAPTGLIGTLGFLIRDPATDAIVLPRTTVGIDEDDPGVYDITFTAPPGADLGYLYRARWDNAAVPLTPEDLWVEDLLVFTGSPPAPSFPTGELTVDKLKLRLNSDQGETADDEFLADVLAETVAFAQTYTRRTFALDPEDDVTTAVRTIAAPAGRPYLFVPDAARAITVVTVAGVAVVGWETVSSIPGAPISYLKLAEATEDPVVITGRFGYAPLPEDLKGAIYADAARRFYERLAGYSDALVPHDEAGGAIQSYFRMLPAKVRATYQAHKARELVLA